MRRQLISLAAFLFIMGCAQSQFIREHSGGEKPISELIRVKGQDNTLFLVTVNGQKKDYEPLVFRGPMVYSGFDLLLDPGEHAIEVYYAVNCGLVDYRTRPQEIKFKGGAGTAYEVYAERVGNMHVCSQGSMKIGIRQLTPPSN